MGLFYGGERLVLKVLVIALLCVIISKGQSIIESKQSFSSDTARYSQLSFERILNTYLWAADLNKFVNDSLWNIRIKQNATSRLIKRIGLAIKDEYKGLIHLERKIKDNFDIYFRNTSDVLADNQVIDLSKSAQHRLIGGVEYRPYSFAALNLGGGYEINSQEKEIDKGLLYTLGLAVPHVRLAEFDLSIDSRLDKSYIGRRSPMMGNLDLVMIRMFDEGIYDSLNLNYSSQRREFYTYLDERSQLVLGLKHNVFSREIEGILINNVLNYRISENISMKNIFTLSEKTIYLENKYKDFSIPDSVPIDRNIKEVQWLAQHNVDYRALKWLRLYGKISYSEREERHNIKEDPMASFLLISREKAKVKRLENITEFLTTTMGFTSDITEKDKLGLMFSASIMRYDTPDTLNTYDRDELFITSNLEYAHFFSNIFSLQSIIEFTALHMVYLHRTQSANNNWNKVLRLSQSVKYFPTYRFHTTVRTELLANYTIYDYQNKTGFLQNYSFRQALWSDSTVIKVFNNIDFKISGNLRIFERGILKWKEFKEKPAEHFIEKYIWPELVLNSYAGIRIGVGFQYFAQDRYKYQGKNKIFIQGVENLGPTVLVEWFGPNNEMLLIKGWYEKQIINRKENLTTSILLMQLRFAI